MNKQILSYMQYHPVRTQRALEIMAGLVPYLVILFVVGGSFFIPETIAYFIITFNVYWLYRSLQLAVNAIIGYVNLKATEKVNWLKKLKEDPQTKDRFQDIYHAVIIPNVKEPTQILERNVASLAKQNFPLKNIFPVLAMEEREGQGAIDRANEIKKIFSKTGFGEVIITYHPIVAGETIGKHSNNTYAARQVKQFLTESQGIPIENIVLTTCDTDSVFPHDYMALLTYRFLLCKKPFRSFFQAALFMYNNLHRLPLLTRLPNIMSGVYSLSLLPKISGRIMNWSTYSVSLKLIDEVGYWDIDVIPEDWHINLKAYFATHGDITVVPLYLSVYIDAAESTTRWKTFKNNYEQIKRWAWGVVDVPYVVKKFFEHPEIPFWNKFLKVSHTFEWHFMWSSSWFLITLGATIPTLLNPAFARTTLGFNLSRISSLILTICLLGTFTITAIDILLRPNQNRRLLQFLHPITYLQWIMLPVVGFFLGSLPGLESQTRLMLGKYIGYKVTEKIVK